MSVFVQRNLRIHPTTKLNMKHHIISFLFLSLILMLTGCSNHVGLSGKVIFSDDQNPLTVGTVNLETNSFFARAPLRPDGTFVVGSLGDEDGLPPGKYHVYISGALKPVTVGEGERATTRFEPLIDQKFTNGATSGIVIEITSTTRDFEIVVDRPGTANRR